MLMRTDPFRETDRIVQQLSGTPGTWSKPSVTSMGADRQGEEYVIAFGLPGVHPEAMWCRCVRRRYTPALLTRVLFGQAQLRRSLSRLAA